MRRLYMQNVQLVITVRLQGKTRLSWILALIDVSSGDSKYYTFYAEHINALTTTTTTILTTTTNTKQTAIQTTNLTTTTTIAITQTTTQSTNIIVLI